MSISWCRINSAFFGDCMKASHSVASIGQHIFEAAKGSSTLDSSPEAILQALILDRGKVFHVTIAFVRIGLGDADVAWPIAAFDLIGLYHRVFFPIR
jgi:hypothetical protein